MQSHEHNATKHQENCEGHANPTVAASENQTIKMNADKNKANQEKMEALQYRRREGGLRQ